MSTRLTDTFTRALEPLHASASAETGLTDFGGSYLDSLQILLRSLDTDLQLSAAHADEILTYLRSVLTARLWTEAGWKRNPDYRDVAIRPIVITGLPRSGTTALHRLLAVDPQFQGIERWLSRTPMPRPPRAQWHEQSGYLECARAAAAFNQAAPGFADAHFEASEEVDECMEILRQSFVSNMFSARFLLPTYTRWLVEQDERASYRRYADALRLIGLADQDKRWLLKNPGHVWHLDNVFENFPQAIVIQLHRDPAQAIPSLCSVMEIINRATLGAQNADPHLIGKLEIDKWARALQRAAAARKAHARQFIDVQFVEFYQEPLTIVKQIYAACGIHLSSEVEHAMQRWLEQQPAAQKHGRGYTPEQFGLTTREIHALCRDYLDTFKIPLTVQ